MQDNNDHNCPLEGDPMHSSNIMPQVEITLHHSVVLMFTTIPFQSEIQLLVFIINTGTRVNHTS